MNELNKKTTVFLYKVNKQKSVENKKMYDDRTKIFYPKKSTKYVEDVLDD